MIQAPENYIHISLVITVSSFTFKQKTRPNGMVRLTL